MTDGSFRNYFPILLFIAFFSVKCNEIACRDARVSQIRDWPTFSNQFWRATCVFQICFILFLHLLFFEEGGFVTNFGYYSNDGACAIMLVMRCYLRKALGQEGFQYRIQPRSRIRRPWWIDCLENVFERDRREEKKVDEMRHNWKISM